MYILINERVLDMLFCSLFLAVGDSSFPSQQPDVEQRDAGGFFYIYIFEMSSCLKERVL